MADAPASGSSSSKSLLWMTGALFGGMAILLFGGLFLAGRVVRSISISNSVGSGTMKTASGGLKVEREKEVGPGIPMYPHSSLIIPGERDAAQAARDAENNVTRVLYHSPDPLGIVDGWYQEHLQNIFQRRDAGQLPLPDYFRELRLSGDDVTFLAEKDAHTRVIALTMEDNGTLITLIRIEKPAAEAPNQPGESTQPDVPTNPTNP